jgi:VCBS repeat-containing protein
MLSKRATENLDIFHTFLTSIAYNTDRKYHLLTLGKFMKQLSWVLVILLFLVSTKVPTSSASVPNQYGSDAVVDENQQVGTSDWQIDGLTGDQNWDADGQPTSDLMRPQAWSDNRDIKGYASEVSINHGESIDLYVSTDQVSYDIDVFRIGWYGGAGGRWVAGVQNLTGQDHGIPSPDPTTGMIEATWPVAYTLNTSSAWVSGVYIAKLTADNGEESYIIFIVRDDSSTSDIMYQIGITTYQAYNNWGGKSLYDFNSDGGRANKVSFDRPYELWGGSGYFFQGDYQMIQWLEREGYDVTYSASTDVETNPNLMNNHEVFLSNYHDEYWSMTMRENLTAALDAGKDLAFFDSNNIYWQIRYESSTDGDPNRVMVCYKDAALDPMSLSVTPELTTVRFREAPVNMPENELLGVMYYADFGDDVNYDYIVQNASHWIYNGTGLQNGDSIPEVVGDEYDNVWDNGLTPDNLEVLSSSPVAAGGISNATIYTADSGALVFDGSTNRWALKLNDTGYDEYIDADSNMQQMTRNLLNTMIGSSPTPVNVPSYIYDDSLTFEWADNNSVDFTDYANTSPVYGGVRSIAFSPVSSSSRISVHAGSPISTTPYTHLRVVMQATEAEQAFRVSFWDSNDQSLPWVNLNNYGGAPSVGSWTIYEIPLADMSAANIDIGRFWLRSVSGVEPTMYIDEIALVAGPPNIPPVAVNDSYSVNEDGTLNVNAATGVLDNDTDDEDDPLTALPLSSTANGSVLLNTDGSFTYSPNDDFNGSDSFTYRANDGTSNSNTATVNITVNAVNDKPSFVHLGDQTVPSGTNVQQTVVNWAYDFDFGPPDESGQSVNDFIVNITSDPDDLFTVDPDVANNGTLTYTPNGSNGTATISVQLRDNGGTSNGGDNTSIALSFTITVETPPPPIASFTTTVVGLTVDFADTSTNSPTSWDWDFDDTNSSIEQNPSHTFSANGVYTVCLTATNSGGNDEACQDVTVTKSPTADFDFVINGLNVNFTDASTDTPTGWSWDFDDTTTSTLQNPSHTFGGGGTYNVCLIATNAGGNDQDCQNVTVVGPPNANFTFVTDDLRVDFADTSNGSPTSWAWTFGDTAISTLQNPSHTYAAIGSFNVCLTVTNASGGAQKCQIVSVSIGAPDLIYPIGTITDPRPDFKWSHIEGATRYRVYVNSSTGLALDQLYDTTATSLICESDICTLSAPLSLTNQSYAWYIRGYTESGYSDWAGPSNIIVDVPAPGMVTKINPSDGSTVSQTDVEFTWTTDSNATWYQLLIYNGTTLVKNQWYSPETACSDTCSGNLTFPIANYTWTVRPYGPGGYGDSGSDFSFSIFIPVPGEIVKTAPLDVISTSTPTFTWQHDSAADWYQIWIGKAGSPVYYQWQSAEAICPDATCSLDTGLTYVGDYSWYVRGWSPGGYGPWGAIAPFSAIIPVPGEIVKTAPLDIISTSTPTFTWDHDAAADWYQIWIGKGGTPVYYEWQSAEAICPDDACSLDTGLTYVGDYSWYVRGWSPGGYGPWGEVASFSAIIPVPGEIVKTAPLDVISTSTPTFTWDHDAAADWYQIWIGKAGSPVYYEWQSAEAICPDDSCSLDTGLTYIGDYTWYVRGWSPGGYGPWGTSVAFSYALALNSPSGTVSGIDITYNWDDLGTSTTSYRLWVGLSSGTMVLDKWVQASIACDGATCSFNDPSTRLSGNYIWYFQPYGIYSYGPWSTGQTFEVAAAFAPLSFVRIESDDVLVSQSGNWYVETTPFASDGNYLYSGDNQDDVLTVEFEGSSVEIIFVELPSSGIFAIEIDNTIYRTVVTSGNSTFDNRAAIDYLDNGHHTVRIYPVEGVIAIDAFIVEN